MSNILSFITSDDLHYTIVVEDGVIHNSNFINNILDTECASSIDIGPITYKTFSIQLPFSKNIVKAYFCDPNSVSTRYMMHIMLFLDDERWHKYACDFISKLSNNDDDIISKLSFMDNNIMIFNDIFNNNLAIFMEFVDCFHMDVEKKLDFVNNNINVFHNAFNSHPSAREKLRVKHHIKYDDTIGKYKKYTIMDKYNNENIDAQYMDMSDTFIIKSCLNKLYDEPRAGYDIYDLIVSTFKEITIFGMKCSKIGDIAVSNRRGRDSEIYAIYTDNNHWIVIICSYNSKFYCKSKDISAICKYKIISSEPISVKVMTHLEINDVASEFYTLYNRIGFELSYCFFIDLIKSIPETDYYIYNTNGINYVQCVLSK